MEGNDNLVPTTNRSREELIHVMTENCAQTVTLPLRLAHITLLPWNQVHYDPLDCDCSSVSQATESARLTCLQMIYKS